MLIGEMPKCRMCCPIEWAVNDITEDGREDERRREWLYVNLLERCVSLKLKTLSAQFHSRASLFGIFSPIAATRFNRAFISYNEDAPRVYSTTFKHRQNKTAICSIAPTATASRASQDTAPRDNISYPASIYLTFFTPSHPKLYQSPI